MKFFSRPKMDAIKWAVLTALVLLTAGITMFICYRANHYHRFYWDKEGGGWKVAGWTLVSLAIAMGTLTALARDKSWLILRRIGWTIVGIVAFACTLPFGWFWWLLVFGLYWYVIKTWGEDEEEYDKSPFEMSPERWAFLLSMIVVSAGIWMLYSGRGQPWGVYGWIPVGIGLLWTGIALWTEYVWCNIGHTIALCIPFAHFWVIVFWIYCIDNLDDDNDY